MHIPTIPKKDRLDIMRIKILHANFVISRAINIFLKMNKSNAAICKRIIQHDRVVYKNADLFTLENQHNSLFIKIEEKIHR